MEDEELNKREIDFEEEISKLWKDGFIAKTYNDAARKHNTTTKTIKNYKIYTDAPHNNFSINLYDNDDKLLMVLIFEAKNKSFKLKNYHLFKQ